MTAWDVEEEEENIIRDKGKETKEEEGEEESQAQTAQDYLRVACRKRSCGTYLITMYLELHQKYQTKQHLAALRAAKGLDYSKGIWETFVAIELWQTVPDAAFIAFCWWKSVRPDVRKKKKRVCGLAIPGLPSLAFSQKKLQQKAIGQWRSGEAVEAYSPAKLAELFKGGSFPIGQVLKTKKDGNSSSLYSGRRLDLRTALTWLTYLGDKHKLFKPSVRTFPSPATSTFLLFFPPFILLLIYQIYRLHTPLNLVFGLMEHQSLVYPFWLFSSF